MRSAFAERRLFLLFASLLVVGLSSKALAASLGRVNGSVQVLRNGASFAPAPGQALSPGDEIRTGRGAACEVRFDDGTRVELGALTAYTLEETKPSMFSMKLALGTARSWVSRISGRRFQMRTPTAVAAVRGTDFRTSVGGDGGSSFDLYEGELGVEDLKGNGTVLQPGQRIEVDESGLGEVQQQSKALEQQKAEERQALAAEVGLNMSKEQVLAAAAEEIKLAEYQAGKAVIDVFGNRVRLEQYILRPQPDQYKLVVLNERSDRFDFFFYQGTMCHSSLGCGRALPDDLSLAFEHLSGRLGSKPDWYLSGYQTGRSNTVDTVEELASGGHLVNLNDAANGTTDDDVTKYFDATLGKFVDVAAGTSFWKTLFDGYEISYNGKIFEKWSGTNIQNMVGGALAPTFQYIQDDGTLGTSAPVSNDDLFPDAPVIHSKLKLAYGSGGYWAQLDNYLVTDEGQIATLDDFPAGPLDKETMLKWNFQQVVTSSQFGGRKIDLVVEPKTLIQSGLVK